MMTPVLLAGGSGTRLWPVSRRSFPKQFGQIAGDLSLFQQSALRLSAPQYGKPLVLTHEDFRFIATEQLGAIGITPADVLIEPAPRNTAPAVLVAALYAAARDPESLVLIAPSDHAMNDPDAFNAAVLRGADEARRGQIVTFGIQPTRAETGYGYLEPAGLGDIAPLRRFVEKPDTDTAQWMLEQGSFLWNAGIFLFKAQVMLDAFRDLAADYMGPVLAAMKASRRDLGFIRLDAPAWEKLPDLSIDYAVMEKAANLSVVRYAGHWSDLGGWDAVWREGLAAAPDAAGVVTQGPAQAQDCRDVLLRSEDADTQIVGIGLENLVVVATSDAVLVADKSRAQQVGAAVKTMKANNIRQSESFRRDHRPWGWFETLALSDRFQVKRIVVKPGGILSLQSHLHRAEHWIVVSGTARVTLDDATHVLTENQSVYIPLGAKHRLENPGKLPMVLIEVQTGGYLGEDDITRYEDIYARP
ncbi:MAG: mannose-1-phosphate guanylyltransferase/mannose-6-phosphate isomerase [Paracoccus sp. (in: a-proteobacteria)]|uniref:mannose-1-phosphate guanylyltransferase/mannose-6-phosphate isomerase n=1 Tax=Paracoccus sp. TaxID=267 RepID=UPI0026DEC88C|nr:mannose-1-phosphate guanylyltransferase/mannose-6-phosphate isomerase [Paracoccus sp. (in: a-proteobacteria)]MDO5622182.1 mannose-1-phosphate guanylyltransferase/mannose-6-phosphate isomerase [Paracoccus sp. (in: a-proteobacteria)]